MKKIFLLSIIAFLLTGCTSINDSRIDDILNSALSSASKATNTYRNGYQYYMPSGLSIKNIKNFNELLEDERYQYFLYVDIISYNHKTRFEYTTNNKAYYSKNIEYNGKNGYIEINNYKNNQYLIEIMYNYAKIEVVVYENDIKHALANAMSVISSITYNNNVISKYLSSSSLETNEEKFDIFEITGSDNYLKVTDEEIIEEKNNDPDYIN